MKILHITASKLTPHSGIPAVLIGLSSEQNKIEGIQARVLSLTYPTDVVGLPFFDELNGSSIQDYLDHFTPDVAVFHSFYQIEFVKVARELKKRCIPFFLEVHGSFGSAAHKKNGLKKWLSDVTIFRTLIRCAKSYIFTNLAEQADSIYHISNELVIPNGINREIIINSPLKHLLPGEQPILYFLGRYDRIHKGLDFLFDALDVIEGRHIPVILHMYGTGNVEQIEYVHNRIRNYSHINVVDKGKAYGEEKKLALEKSHILVLTSRYEGSPITILDGWSYGNPCFVTSGTNVADESVREHIGWKADYDATKMADQLLSAIEDYRNNYGEFYRKCKQYLLDNYTWDRLAKFSIQEYTRILGL